jgi:adenosylcobinamide-GDP ribazoletransferase
MNRAKSSQKKHWFGSIVDVFWGAIAFYTCFPVPPHWSLEFQGIARWAPVIGMLIGGLLGVMDQALHILQMPIWVRSALVVVVWILITGGLHLDGAMDTADGLAVLDPQRRLQVMSDSHAGAFGVMAAISLLLLKTIALSNLESERYWILIGAAAWGRWGQLVAIAQYPYLKPEGKGALHKMAIHSLWDTLPSLLILLGFSGLLMGLYPNSRLTPIYLALGGATLAVATGAWFNHKLSGHTGDTYGAVVEWTEALLLCWMTISP